MKSLTQIRKAYEENYQKMIDVIQAMGGDDCIKLHRKSKSQLYRQLKDLQRHEHYLDELENRLLTHQTMVH
ncbi:MAG: hypothetical protein KDH97_01930 [Calditrichaeota bacterium]|nr:hypothetical protein [Calditrichota bacterium]MCB0288992.1 hypothetical protein [Calditrichota bacterium]MCB0295136.1 hypothetical protein [Calditrichota bacterium]MCB0303234.1 hypothetical protein [Calditrichota bacterium]MCB9090552.1 hypothetical protein [Calditrichia bacterium]